MILIIDFGSSKVPEIEREIRGLGYNVLVKKWDADIDLRDARGIVLSGAPILLTKTDATPYIEKFAFLKTTLVPVLGICFGHQLIGLLHGAKVFLGEENRKEKQINFLCDSDLFKGLENPSVFVEDHTEGITLPNDFICTASSDDYEVEAMQHKTKNIFGVQFHPEVSGANGSKFFKNFLRIISNLEV